MAEALVLLVITKLKTLAMGRITKLTTLAMGKMGSVAGDYIGQEFQLVRGVQTEAEKLASTLESIRAVLEDAEKKQVTSRAVKIWLHDFKDIMYDVDDVLDEWFTRIGISKPHAMDGPGVFSKIFTCLSSNCSCFQPLFFLVFGDNFQPVKVRYDIAHSIKSIRGRMDALVQNMNQLSLIANQTTRVYNPQQQNFTSSIYDASEIVGRENDKQLIINILFAERSSSSQTSAHVVCIVGMGGLGKTTLAQLIHNNERVTTQFELRLWVCVSGAYDRERLAKEIIQQATGGNPDVIGWDALHQLLSRSVQGKRFLLILDDMWSEDRNDWAPLKKSLNGGAQGSRIVVTTRSKKVAKMMGSTYTHELEQLSDEKCWSLFQRIAFEGKSQEQVESLEEIGRELAKKCKGVPLAAETLASRMVFADSRDEWRNVLKSDLWDVPTSEDAKGFFPALLLSYQALSPQLKQCFIYTAIFPEDALIEKDELVKLWMAQGYLGLDGELEIIGRWCFDDLAMRSFFQKHKSWDGRDVWKMHDLVREFAQFLAKTEISLERNDFSSNKVRHMPVNAMSENSIICEGSKVRTLIVSNRFQISNPKLLELLQKLKCLRALELRHSGISVVPDEVGTLSHLRYLNFLGNPFSELPETVCDLYNLQTLILTGCYSLRKLPEGVGRLSNLRHLEIQGTFFLDCFPKSIGELSRLRTLCKFRVSEEGTIRELERLDHLCGALQIQGINGVKDGEEGKRAQLAKKEGIRDLALYGWWNLPQEDEVVRVESVWESLKPNGNLEILKVEGYPCSSFPRWMSPCDFPNIVELELRHCKCKQLPPALGKLQHLRTLTLKFFPLVKELGAQLLGDSNSGENGGASEIVLFPKLRQLVIRRLFKWEEEMEKPISSTSIMPCLQRLSIEGCPKLKVVPQYMTSSFSGNLGITIEGCPRVESLRLEGRVTIDGNTGANLKYLCIYRSQRDSINDSFFLFKSVQYLRIEDCEFLELNPDEDLRSFSMLRQLEIFNCPKLEECCSRDDWGSRLSHLPYKFIINKKEITKGKGVPDFWVNAMKTNKKLAYKISERDEKALKFLKDIKWHKIEDPKGFVLEFFFDTNPFFKNSVLTKTYHVIDDDEPILEKTIGTEIEWFPGKSLTQKILKKKPKKGSKNAKPITETKKCESFFNFFNPPQVPEDDDDIDEDVAEQLQTQMEYDYDIRSVIRDQIIPDAHVVSWLTGV